MTYVVPETVPEAIDLLAGGNHTIVAGGTDFYPARVGRPIVEDVVDISRLTELRGISTTEEGHRIGALTTWSDLAGAELPPGFEGLRRAALSVGGVQIQNAATVAGNLCNASPAADGIPPLLTLDASVEITSAKGVRTLPLDRFLTGYRTTALEPGEMVTAILVPRRFDHAYSAFHKLGSRHYLVISIVMVAATLATDSGGNVTAARLAVGACTPVAVRLTALENELVGCRLDDDLAAVVGDDHLSPLAPIDDVRASGDYRRHAAAELVRRCLADAT